MIAHSAPGNPQRLGSGCPVRVWVFLEILKGLGVKITILAIKISQETLNKEKSFAIRVTRTGNHDFSSQDVAVKIGNAIVKATKATVNLIKPDFELFIEIRNDNSFIFTEKIRGTGGLP